MKYCKSSVSPRRCTQCAVSLKCGLELRQCWDHSLQSGFSPAYQHFPWNQHPMRPPCSFSSLSPPSDRWHVLLDLCRICLRSAAGKANPFFTSFRIILQKSLSCPFESRCTLHRLRFSIQYEPPTPTCLLDVFLLHRATITSRLYSYPTRSVFAPFTAVLESL